MKKISIYFVLGLSLVVGWFFLTQPEEIDTESRLHAMYLKLPNKFFEFLLNGEPETVDGQRLHPKLQYAFEISRGKTPVKYYQDTWKSPEGRAMLRSFVDDSWTYRALQSPEMKSVNERRIPGPGGDIPARIYVPYTDVTAPLPVLVYFHGGGFIMASINAVDRITRLIANEARSIVVSIDYRLAPEHPYPAANEDAIAALNWVINNVDELGGKEGWVAIGGDSAGAYLSIVTTHHQIEQNKPLPVFQLLYYPPVDFDFYYAGDTPSIDYPSQKLFGEGYGLDSWLTDMMLNGFFPDGIDRNDILMRPVLLPTLGAMPNTLIALAGFDPIRDQGKLLAENMQDAGAEVDLRVYGSLAHNFLEHTATIDDAREAAIDTARAYGKAMYMINNTNDR